MSRTLMTPVLVNNYTGIKKNNFSPCDFRELYSIEFREARKCLGLRFWQSMVDLRADYSDKLPYESKAYLEGDIVSYQGLYYIALKDTSAMPSVHTDWDEAPYFEGDCADKISYLFCNFLAPYLANVVLSSRLPYIWSSISADGVLTPGNRIGSSEFQSVDGLTYDRLQSAIHRDRQIAFDNMLSYLGEEDNLTEPCLALFQDRDKLVDKDLTCGCGGAGCRQCTNGRQSRAGIYQFG